MKINTLIAKINEYNRNKGYGRLWGIKSERMDIILLKQFINLYKVDVDISYMDFHQWLQTTSFGNYQFYKNTMYSDPPYTTFSDTNLSMKTIFRPWFDELTAEEKRKVAIDNIYGYKTLCSGGKSFFSGLLEIFDESNHSFRIPR